MSNVRNTKFIPNICACILCVAALCAAGCSDSATTSASPDATLDVPLVSPTPIVTDELKVHFIDVGQGDCIFIEQSGTYMLIDAGTKDKGELVVSYLKAHGVDKLTYIISTHPHADHIGGLIEVVKNFKPDTLLMTEATINEDEYEEFEALREELDINTVRPQLGERYDLGQAHFTVIGPDRIYPDNVNNSSISISLKGGGDVTFLLCGDANAAAENAMLKSDFDLGAYVWKVNHHGSSGGSTRKFIEAVNPRIMVMQVAAVNPFGYPDAATVKRLEKQVDDNGAQLFSTSDNGSVVITCNDGNVSVETEKQ